LPNLAYPRAFHRNAMGKRGRFDETTTEDRRGNGGAPNYPANLNERGAP
jgi:hypothetical protein